MSIVEEGLGDDIQDTTTTTTTPPKQQSKVPLDLKRRFFKSSVTYGLGFRK